MSNIHRCPSYFETKVGTICGMAPICDYEWVLSPQFGYLDPRYEFVDAVQSKKIIENNYIFSYHILVPICDSGPHVRCAHEYGVSHKIIARCGRTGVVICALKRAHEAIMRVCNLLPRGAAVLEHGTLSRIR